jgi:hypothetical protein
MGDAQSYFLAQRALEFALYSGPSFGLFDDLVADLHIPVAPKVVVARPY